MEELRKKLKFESKAITDNKGKAMANAVIDALVCFAEQEPEFYQAIMEGGKSFKDCMNNVTKGVGNYISGLEAYNRAAQFYFMGAEVEFMPRIKLHGTDTETPGNLLNVDLTDLLGV